MKNIITALVAAVSIADKIYQTLKDGFQPIQDGLVIWQQVPKLTEIATNAKSAWKEARELPADQYDELIAALGEELELSNEATEEKVRKVVNLLSRTVREIEGDVAVFKAWQKTFDELRAEVL